MKKSTLLLVCVSLFMFAGIADARPGFSGGGGGFVIVYQQPDLKDINNQILQMGIPELDEGFFLYGGQGYGYVNRNFRIGGMGAGGAIATSALVPGFGGAPDLAKEVEFMIGYGGVTLEYVYDTPIGLQLFGGGMIGWGGISLRVSQYENALSWSGIWEDYHSGYPGDSNDISIMMDNYLFILSPWAGAFYKILPWMGVSGKAGYFYSTADSKNWTTVGSDIFGGPDIDLSNVYFEFAFVFGG